jgi:glycosyltransferase involved in cell wall biosynthesis
MMRAMPTHARTTLAPATAGAAFAAPAVDVVIPVYNEERALERCVRTLHEHMYRELGLPFVLTIADNASTDGTLLLAHRLARELTEVSVIHLELKGRGRALRAAWSASRAHVLAYMDVDLSTDLSALAPLLEPLLAGTGDIAIGSRLLPGSRVQRSLRRELISRAYNLLLSASLGAAFSDAQCGFKAGRREAIHSLLAHVHDEAWFFDTELLHLAQRRKLAIHEVPVTWVEDRDSRVRILATMREDLLGIRRLRAAEQDARRRPRMRSHRSGLRRLRRASGLRERTT